MRARTSFASKEIANGASRAKRKHRGRRLDDGDMARTRVRGTGRNPDRGSEALSPRGILYARTRSEMARETRPGPRFGPAVSAPVLGVTVARRCDFACRHIASK